MPVDLDNTSTVSGHASVSVGKKKRNLPGMPDPEAEVIALSPTTLMTTNRFVCEICNKGFQRDQNLQLHRRGHNLPWKLRQRSSSKEVIRKKVYVCPVVSCVHHDRLRALGDLTGIKKHFCRKHGEKKWKCEKCEKKYAVQSDWKAHLKICGTKEYKCDCGTLFSRRDSFITHRAFCDALAQESNHHEAMNEETPITNSSSSNVSNGGYASLFVSSPSLYASSSGSPSVFAPSSSVQPFSLCLSTSLTPEPAMSATALLQKAAQMGSTGSGGLGIVSTSNHDAGSFGLGLPCSNGGSGSGSRSGLKELMMGNSCVFGQKQTTLDFLGLGRAVGGTGGGLSAMLTSTRIGEYSGKDIGKRGK